MYRRPFRRPTPVRPARLGFVALEDRTVPTLVGRLDPLFNGTGQNSFGTFVGTDDIAAAVAFQPDGRFVVAGTVVNPGGNEDIQILRFNSNGTPDNTFAGTGRVFVAFDLGGTNNDRARAVAVQADGKIVVAGYATSATGKDMAVVRLNANGGLDTAFDGDGKLTFDLLGNDDEIAAIAIQPTGEIVLAGYQGFGGTDRDFALVRLNANGSFDTSLDVDGKRTYAIDDGDGNTDEANAIALQPDGKIVLAGFARANGQGKNFAVIRALANGDRDTSFGTVGEFTTDFSNGVARDDFATGVAIQADGRIVIAGLGDTGTPAPNNSTDFGLVRLTAVGKLDTTFDGDGKKLVAFDIGGSKDDAANAVFIQPDGRIVTAGFATFGGTDKDFAVARLNADGSADTTFDGDGLVFYAFDSGGGGVDVALGAALDPSGRIVLVGTTSTDTNANELAFVRAYGQEVPLVVSTTADEADGNISAGKLSLREAITLANLDLDDNAITFAAGLTGTITLGSDLPAIIGNTTITGPGASKLAVSGNDVNRVFVVNDQSAALINVSISGLTLTRGLATSSTGGASATLGGAIFSNENLTLTALAVTDNTVNGAIFQGAGTLNVTGSKFFGNQNNNSAAAILASGGSLAIADSTFSNNSGAGMGAIFTDTAATVSGSTFVGNTASSGGQGGGAAILLRNGPLAVTNSTFSSNTAAGGGGAIRVNEGALAVSNSTFTLNRTDSDGTGEADDAGGGIFVSNVATASAKLVNAIVSGNLIGTGATPDDLGGKALEASSSNNLIGGNAGLLPLANNGGPTQTHALLAGSPAVNAGAASALATDQRGAGFPRSLGGAVDIGAFELAIPTNLVVDNAGDADDGNFAAGQLTLREAIGIANARAGADAITFANGLAPVTLTTATLSIADTTGKTTVSGPAGGTQVIQRSTAGGTPEFGVFFVGTNADGAFVNLTIANGRALNGGGIQNFGKTLVNASTIRDNTTTSGNGAGIENNQGTLTVLNTTISGNAAGQSGGGVNNFQGVVVVENSTISGNTTLLNGGGIRNNGGTLTITHGTIVGNRADSDANGGTGGGLNDSGTSTLRNTIVAGNLVGTGSSASDLAGTVVAASSNNIVGDAGSSGGLTNGSNGNVVGVAVADVINTALANNGGPTLTHSLNPNGPALGTASKAFMTATDQRGFMRPADPTFFPDIGAVEPQLLALAPPTLLNGTINTPYNQTLTASLAGLPAGTTFTFQIASGSLPAGLTLSPGGAISGTPTTAGTANFEIAAIASTGDLALPTALSITIVAVNTPPTISNIANQSGAVGTVIGPIGFSVADAQTPAGAISVTGASSNTALVPVNGITFGGNGGDRTVTVTPAAGQTGTATITVTVTDGNGATASETFVVTVAATPAGPNPLLVGFREFAVGADVGGSTVSFFNAAGALQFSVTPFPGFTGGVRTAAADFNADGIADIVAGTGPGRATRVVVLDGVTQNQLFAVDPFEASFTGGVYVAAGDVNGDGVPDLAITPDEGGGPRVDMYSGNGFAKIVSFFGIDDPNFRGGARASIADMTGDGVGDLIVVAGFGGGPRVAGFDGTTLSKTPEKIFGDFFAFEETLRNGIFVTAGDLNGDGFADLIAGGGPGGGPRVLVFDGKSLLGNQYVNLANFFGGDPDGRGGIRLAVKDLDGDAQADLVVGSGAGAGSRVTGYLGKTIQAAGTPPAAFDFDVFSGFAGGIFVG